MKPWIILLALVCSRALANPTVSYWTAFIGAPQVSSFYRQVGQSIQTKCWSNTQVDECIPPRAAMGKMGTLVSASTLFMTRKPFVAEGFYCYEVKK